MTTEDTRNETIEAFSNLTGTVCSNSVSAERGKPEGHVDITGTAVAATDEKGEVIWREQRRAYGEIKVDPLKPRSLDEFSAGYTGHQADKESGLTYAKARYYNKSIGRFYAPDPIPFREDDLVSINRYAYAGNNPYKYTDPTGTTNSYICGSGGYCASPDDARDLGNMIAGGLDEVSFGVSTSALNFIGIEPDVNSDEFAYGRYAVMAVEVAAGGYGLYKHAAKEGIKQTGKAALKVCFVKGTLVETPDGKVAIEDIKVGDLVLSKDDLTGKVAFKQVTTLFRNADKLIYELSVVNEQGESEVIGTTAEHPFYVDGKGWTESIQLVIGDEIITDSDDAVTVTAVTLSPARQDTYNFEVDDYHTYFVGENRLWVHNACTPRFKGASKTTLSRLDKVLSDASDSTVGSGVKNFTQEKSRNRLADYEWLTANGRVLRDTPNLKLAELPDGNKVIYRNSKEGYPTIEIQKPDGKAALKIRYQR